MFLCGVTLTIGLQNTFQFFFQVHKIKVVVIAFTNSITMMMMQGTTLFYFGLLVVLFGWPLIGMIIEAFGFFYLFRCTHTL